MIGNRHKVEGGRQSHDLTTCRCQWFAARKSIGILGGVLVAKEAGVKGAIGMDMEIAEIQSQVGKIWWHINRLCNPRFDGVFILQGQVSGELLGEKGRALHAPPIVNTNSQ